jgi:CTP:molybdopterin cytidylyltransferase MocA
MVMGRDMMEAFLRAPADSTARAVREQLANRVRYVEVEDANVVRNVNTPEDYAHATETITGESA